MSEISQGHLIRAVRPEDACQPFPRDFSAAAKGQERESPVSFARKRTRQKLSADKDLHRPKQTDSECRFFRSGHEKALIRIVYGPDSKRIGAEFDSRTTPARR